ncbi:hypothetical protein EUTSA_v10001548mg [Eutrema salsugineum]|uniref:Zinc finger protein CONSTANS-LIKE 13 n=1 Tax=Eutrema salsugineum TaxID=72664 RepID=V4N2K7_EUTSA|nr:zinc finger protein CONSTANS-LIKE 13 [Eutrema salsugineum]ESQ39436.1 hypothetical protein EUTSA_v10001548mg [Eutrema salsugineum]
MAEELLGSHRVCDYCDSSVALVYCKADSAKLCLACDKHVHVTNQLFSKHFRSLLCDSCDDSPSSVFCDSERSLLCQNCDWQHHHSSSSPPHSLRRPVEGFSGCPSVSDFLALVGLHDLTDKSLLLWDTPPEEEETVALHDLTTASSHHNFRAMDVPPLPKNRHATCGRHRDEMIRQLRELSRSEPNCLKYETPLDAGFQFLNDDDLFSTCDEASGLKWFEDQQDEQFPYSSLHNKFPSESDDYVSRRGCPPPESSSVMVVPVSTSSASRSALPCHEINSLERNSALSRYKAKKKSRRYEKHIRYESRKVRAESRTRVRGRFAKADP